MSDVKPEREVVLTRAGETEGITLRGRGSVRKDRVKKERGELTVALRCGGCTLYDAFSSGWCGYCNWRSLLLYRSSQSVFRKDIRHCSKTRRNDCIAEMTTSYISHSICTALIVCLSLRLVVVTIACDMLCPTNGSSNTLVSRPPYS